MLVLHLVPDGVGGLDALLDMIVQSQLLQFYLDGDDELIE